MPPAPVHPDHNEANVEQATTKTCRKCGIPQGVDNFSLARDRKDGHADWCRPCARAWANAKRAETREAYNARAAENYRKRNAEKIAAREAAIRAQLAATSQPCRRCGVDKPLDAFRLNAHMLNGRRSWCLDCDREYARQWNRDHPEIIRERTRRWSQENKTEVNARRRARRAADPTTALARRRIERRLSKFDLDGEQLAAMLAAQAGCCAICGEDITGETPYRGSMRTKTCVDHDHKTSLVRGLLCHLCNQSLGGFKDDPARLRSAIEYLERHQA